MVTIEEAKQSAQQEEQSIKEREAYIYSLPSSKVPARTTYYQTHPKEYQKKVAEARAVQEFQKQESSKLQTRKQSLETYKEQVSKAEQEAEQLRNQELARYQADVQRYQAEKREWEIAEKLVRQGKGYVARDSPSIMDKVKKLKDAGMVSSREQGEAYRNYAKAKKEYEEYQAQSVYTDPQTGLKYSIAPEFQQTIKPSTTKFDLEQFNKDVKQRGVPISEIKRYQGQGYSQKEATALAQYSQATQTTPTPQIARKYLESQNIAPSFKKTPVRAIGYSLQQPNKYLDKGFEKVGEYVPVKLGFYQTQSSASSPLITKVLPKDYVQFKIKPSNKIMNDKTISKDKPVFEVQGKTIADVGSYFIPNVAIVRLPLNVGEFTGKGIVGTSNVYEIKKSVVGTAKAIPSVAWGYTKENPFEVAQGVISTGLLSYKGFQTYKASKVAKGIANAETEFVAVATPRGELIEVNVLSTTKADKNYVVFSKQVLKSAGARQTIGKGAGFVLNKGKAGSTQITKFATAGETQEVGKARAVIQSQTFKISGESGKGILAKSVSKDIASIRATRSYNAFSGEMKTTTKLLDVSDDITTSTIAGRIKPIDESKFFFQGGKAKLRIYKTGDITYIAKPNIKGLIFIQSGEETSQGVNVIKNIQSSITKQLSTQTGTINAISNVQPKVNINTGIKITGAVTSFSSPQLQKTKQMTEKVQLPQFKQPQIQKQMQQPKLLLSSNLKTEFKQADLTKNLPMLNTKVSAREVERFKQIQPQIPTFKQPQPSKLKQPPSYKAPNYPMPYVPTPSIPKTSTINVPLPVVRPSFSFKQRFRDIFAKPNYQYTPSYRALLFNIKGKQPETKVFTGLETRPITKGFSWQRIIKPIKKKRNNK